MKIVKYVLISVAVVLVIIQFFRIDKNAATGDKTNHISTQFAVSAEVELILKSACYDCHSNTTVYPWYTNIQPVGWWLQHHVNEGKGELNFDEFAAYTPRKQAHKMEEAEEMVEKGNMPLSSYTWMHGDAVLSPSQKEALSTWIKSVTQEIKTRNPGTATGEGKH